MKRIYIFALALVVFAYLPVSATIINIPDDYPTVQQGIDASIDGDTVLIQPGTYVENINFNGHNIVLGSLFLTTGDISFISQTIIDGNQSGSVVTFENGEDNTTVITGFTLQNGLAPSAARGGGIFCNISSPTIASNIIWGNFATIGAGIMCDSSNPLIINNIIRGNISTGEGGGIFNAYNSSSTISNNAIIGNSSASWGGGIFCANSIIINNNTISGNSATYGGGIYCYDSEPPIITNNIFWANTAPNGSEVYTNYSSPIITYCDIQGGWEGEGNIDCDPMFCEPESGNFYLDAFSCCVGAGEDGVDIGALGIGCGQEIPTLSEWGMLIMGLLLLAVVTVALIEIRKAALSNLVLKKQ